MIDRYRTRVVRVQAIRVTRESLQDPSAWPAGCNPTNVMLGDFMVKWPGTKTWLSVPGSMFEQDFEPDQPAELLRIAK